MTGWRIADNGDGSEFVEPDEMSDELWEQLLPQQRHLKIWTARVDDPAPERRMGVFRKIVWLIAGV